MVSFSQPSLLKPSVPIKTSGLELTCFIEVTFGNHNIRGLVEKCKEGYEAVSQDDLKMMVEVLMEQRKEMNIGFRMMPKAQAVDYTATCKRVDEEVCITVSLV